MSMMSGKVAWITGGGSGIGLAAAIKLAKAGCRVVISGRNADKLDAAIAEAVTRGAPAGKISMSQLDVSDRISVDRVADSIQNECAPIDILVSRPVQPTDEDKARMLQEEDLGRVIRFIAEMPPHACINELVISPVWNRIYIGGDELKRH